jgi:hypothetical protein
MGGSLEKSTLKQQSPAMRKQFKRLVPLTVSHFCICFPATDGGTNKEKCHFLHSFASALFPVQKRAVATLSDAQLFSSVNVNNRGFQILIRGHKWKLDGKL